MNGSQQKQFAKALIDAFPTEVALAKLVTFDLGENFDAIAGGNDLSQRVFNLIVWAKSQNRLDELLDKARAENPGNPVLAAFSASYNAQRAPVAPAPQAPAGPAGPGTPGRAVRDLRAKVPWLVAALAATVAISIVIDHWIPKGSGGSAGGGQPGRPDVTPPAPLRVACGVRGGVIEVGRYIESAVARADFAAAAACEAELRAGNQSGVGFSNYPALVLAMERTGQRDDALRIGRELRDAITEQTTTGSGWLASPDTLTNLAPPLLRLARGVRDADVRALAEELRALAQSSAARTTRRADELIARIERGETPETGEITGQSLSAIWQRVMSQVGSEHYVEAARFYPVLASNDRSGVNKHVYAHLALAFERTGRAAEALRLLADLRSAVGAASGYFAGEIPRTALAGHLRSLRPRIQNRVVAREWDALLAQVAPPGSGGG